MQELIERICPNCEATNRLQLRQLLTTARVPRCGRCKKALLRSFDKPLSQIDPSHYVHDLDRAAMENLHRIPGVRTVLRRVLAESVEKASRLFHHANFVKVTHRQISSVRDLYEEAAVQLGITDLPDIYLYQDPVPNAYTYGVKSPIIAVSSGLVELLEPNEQLAVLAHELGHWQTDHVLYKTAARLIGELTAIAAGVTLGLGAVALMPIQVALYRWDRASELTADRAALLATRNPETVLRALMKLAGGSQAIYEEMSFSAFLEQAEEFGEMKDESLLSRFFVAWDVTFRTHPYPVWRAQEVVDWVENGAYLDILDGEYPTMSPVPTDACEECGGPTPAGTPICPRCLSNEADDEREPGFEDASNGDEPGVQSMWQEASERASETLDQMRDWFQNPKQ